MELLGLALAFPAVFAANVVYSAFVRFGVRRWRFLWPWLLWPSRFVLGLLAVNLIGLAALGPSSLHRTLGSAFWWLQELVIFLGAPALANVLLIPGARRWYHRWYIVAGLCFCVGMLLVFLQVGLGDAVLGVE